jgi:hypothetical protein
VNLTRQIPSSPESPPLELKEGMHITFERCSFTTPRNMFVVTLVASASLGGKATVCKGLLPGVSLRIRTDWTQDQVNQIALQMWDEFWPILDQWVNSHLQAPRVIVPAHRTEIIFSQDVQTECIDDVALQFTVTPVWH